MELYSIYYLHPTFSSRQNVFEVHPCCSIYQWAICFYLSVVWIIPNFLYPSTTVVGHLDYFYFLAIMSNATMNINIQFFV